MTFLVGTIFVGESARDMYSGFPVDLLVLLTGVTYLFAIAASNGTVERIVEAAARLVKGRRALIPWIVFVVAALPAMAGALGSAGVALLAPMALRLARALRHRSPDDRPDGRARRGGRELLAAERAERHRPQAVARSGLEMSAAALFLGNLAYNVALAVVIYLVFGG